MILVEEVVDRCLNEWLVGTYSTQLNVLQTAIDAETDQVVLKYGTGGTAQGGLIAINTELLTIVNKDVTANTVICIRGARGTAAQTHRAGAVVEPNPRYYRRLVIDAVLAELLSWPAEVYRFESLRVPVAMGDTAIEVTTTLPIRRILGVQRPGIRTGDQRDFRVGYRAAFDVKADGDAYVYLDNASERGGDYVIHLATDWDVDRHLFDEYVDLADVGLAESMVEVLILGSCWRLVLGREARRLEVEAQGQSRDAQEVPPAALTQLARVLKSMRDERLAQEARRLTDRYGFA